MNKLSNSILFTIFFIVFYMLVLMIIFNDDKDVNKYMKNIFIYALIVFVVYYLILKLQESDKKETYGNGIVCYPNTYRANADESYESLIKGWCSTNPPHYDSNVLDNYDEIPTGDEHSCPFNSPELELSGQESYDSLTKSKCSDFYDQIIT